MRAAHSHQCHTRQEHDACLETTGPISICLLSPYDLPLPPFTFTFPPASCLLLPPSSCLSVSTNPMIHMPETHIDGLPRRLDRIRYTTVEVLSIDMSGHLQPAGREEGGGRREEGGRGEDEGGRRSKNI